MDEIMTVKEILETYENISVGKQITDGVLFFTLFEKQFLLIAPAEEDPTSKADIYLFDDDLSDQPHIMLRETSFADIKAFPDGIYRWICLYEQGSIVNTLVSYEDKIFDCIDRLIELMTMNQADKEREFQKEFMYYWNSEATGSKKYTVYIADEARFSEMEVFFGSNDIRLIDQDLALSDMDKRDKGELKWIRHLENEVYHIPITDSRDILPPHRGFEWTKSEVQNIVYGKQIEHISEDSFQKLRTIIPKRHAIILLFSMKTEQSNVVFALKVNCKSIAGRTLMEKLLSDVISVEPLRTERKDYTYLCEQIGNDTGLMRKTILLIGAGSGVVILALTPIVLKVIVLEPQAQYYLKFMMFMAAYYIIGNALNSTVIAGIFPAGGDTRFGMICDIVTLWCVVVPMGMIAAFWLKLPVLAVAFILTLDEFVKIPAVYKHYMKYKWLKNITR